MMFCLVKWRVPWLIRLALWLSALTVLTVLIGPVLQCGLTGGDPGKVLVKWLEGLSLVTQIIASVPGMALVAVLSAHWAITMGLVHAMNSRIRKWWIHWTWRLNFYLWDIEYVLDQDEYRSVGAYCTTKSRRELDHLEMLHRVDRGHREDQDEMVQRFLDNGMKFFGYRNYLLDTMKNCEALAERYRATVTEKQPQGDPGLLEQIKLAILILQQEQKNLETKLCKWTWE